MPEHPALKKYEPIVDGHRHALVKRTEKEAVGGALIFGSGCEQIDGSGRGYLQRFALKKGTGIVRRYHRGGAVCYLLNDRYCLDNRPLKELKLHVEVHARGLSVPEPLGAVWERTGLWYRGAIATRELDARHMLHYLKEAHGTCRDIMERAGKLIRQMHDMGVYHADLQLRNILVGEEELYLIDFDNCRICRNLSPFSRARNLLRFRRSMEKNGVSDALFPALVERYGNEVLPKWLDMVYKAKGKMSDAASGRSNGHAGS